MSAATVVGGCGLQLQQLGVDSYLSFSGHYLWIWTPPHHTQRAGCLQLAQTWPNFWQLQHCISIFWALCASTLMTTWLSLVKLKTSGDFSLRARVTRKNRRFTILVPPWAISLVTTRMPFRVLWNSKLPLVIALTSAWNFNTLTVVVRIIGGGLNVPLAAFFCCWVRITNSIPSPDVPAVIACSGAK